MAKKPIANANMTIQVKSPATGQVTVISQPSTNVKAGGSGVYRGPLQFSVSNLVSGSCGTAAPGTLPQGVIQPTAQYTKADQLAVIREGDKAEGLASVGAMVPVPGGQPAPCVINFSVEVIKAGQSDVLGS